MPLLTLALAIGIRFWLLGVAIAYTLRNLLILYPSIAVAGRLIDLTFGECVRACVAPGLLAVSMGIAVYAVRVSVPWPHVLVDLFGSVALGVALYLLGAWVFRLTAFTDALATLRRLLGRGSPPADDPVP